jgi:hypothetical protein
MSLIKIIFYHFDFETSGKKYDGLVELASEKEIFISTQQAKKIMKKWFQ